MRVVGVLIAVAAMFAALTAVAWGQTTTPTPTPTPTPSPSPSPTPTATPTPEPTPTPEEEKQARLRKRTAVKRVYRDFRDDGLINKCEHSKKALQRTLESISDEFNIDFPDFRPAVKSAIKDWDKDRCAEAEATPTPSPTATSTPSPTTTPAPTTTPPPSTDSGNAPDAGSGAVAPPPPPKPPKPPKAKQPSPPSEGDVTPVQPSPTPSPAATPTPPQEAQLVVTRPDGDTNLLVPALILAAALAGLAIAGGSAALARRDGTGPLAAWGQAWREAGYRASGAWSDFGDWLRVGR
jgi:outer membrane biosynthesis protein TonB